MTSGVRRAIAAAALAAAAAGGCSRPSWLRAPSLPDVSMPTVQLPDLGGGASEARVSEVEVVGSEEVADFYALASEFYRRLEGRRFNSIASFRDGGLREYFATDDAFIDYYADLADDLAIANFERSVPLGTQVREFLVDGPGRARVRVRISGRDGRPLRFWSTDLEREDRWERQEGRWWIKPSGS